MTGDAFAARWRSALGKGPAHVACSEAVEQFALAFDATRKRLQQGHVAAAPDTSGSAREAADTHGFGWEGEAAALTLSGDPGVLQRRLDSATAVESLFLKLGVGFARSLQGLAPRGPMEADGAGFAEGLLRTRRALDRRIAPDVPADLQAWADHGVGRSVWYVLGGSPAGIVRLMTRFPPDRLESLWRGLGVAMVFTGGPARAHIRRLVELCPRLSDLRRGASWAHAVRPLPDDLQHLVLPDGPVPVQLDFEALSGSTH